VLGTEENFPKFEGRLIFNIGKTYLLDESLQDASRGNQKNRLTTPYNAERWRAASEAAKKTTWPGGGKCFQTCIE
jgi:hypothetical protein